MFLMIHEHIPDSVIIEDFNCCSPIEKCLVILLSATQALPLRINLPEIDMNFIVIVIAYQLVGHVSHICELFFPHVMHSRMCLLLHV